MSAPDYRPLAHSAAQAYRHVGRFAYGFARGKLLGDPVFRFVLGNGYLSNAATILDLGCGQGVLAALIRAAQQRAQNAGWPIDWAVVPRAENIIGIDLMSGDIERGRQALGDAARFMQGDIASTPFPAADSVVIFDVLHYLPYDKQERVLQAVRRTLTTEGVLLLRIGDASGGLGFMLSQWVDRVVTWCQGHRLPRLYCRELSAWEALLRQLGFAVKTEPMSEGTLFSNVLLIATKRPDCSDD